jgi:predicted O-methyltransferase YrrM
MDSMRFRLESFVRGVRFRLTRRLADRTPTELWPGIDKVVIRQRPFASRFGNVKPHELTILCALVRLLRPVHLFEFGTFDGLTAWHLLRNAGGNSRLWTLDLPLDHPVRQAKRHDRSVGKVQGITVGHHYRNTPEESRVTQLYQDSLQFDPAPYRESIDFCFIDAGHEFAHVSCDTRNALEMMRPGGVIVWHDYSRWWRGVQRCLDELSKQMPVFRLTNTALAVTQLPSPFTDSAAWKVDKARSTAKATRV